MATGLTSAEAAALPAPYFVFLIVVTASYLLLVEIVKRPIMNHRPVRALTKAA